jgi:hypothetical protein
MEEITFIKLLGYGSKQMQTREVNNFNDFKKAIVEFLKNVDNCHEIDTSKVSIAEYDALLGEVLAESFAMDKMPKKIFPGKWKHFVVYYNS